MHLLFYLQLFQISMLVLVNPISCDLFALRTCWWLLQMIDNNFFNYIPYLVHCPVFLKFSEKILMVLFVVFNLIWVIIFCCSTLLLNNQTMALTSIMSEQVEFLDSVIYGSLFSGCMFTTTSFWNEVSIDSSKCDTIRIIRIIN